MTRSGTAYRRFPALETVDGGRSHAVQRSLEHLVGDIRATLGAEIALALYHGLGCEPHGRVLAWSADDAAGPDPPLPNEPIWLGEWSDSGQPLSQQDVVLRSALRPYTLELVSALIIPWAHTSGRGWLVAGMPPGAWNSGMLDLSHARNYASKLRQAHMVAGLRGANRLQREVADAAHRLAEAEVNAPDPTSLLESVALGACALLGTAASYIALPAGDGDFVMSAHLNVRTARFRRLRLHAEQGLGGLANRERCAIISSNYPEDARLVDPPIVESLREGFLSAICVPLVAGDEVVGLLYTANRQLTPFTETDAALLAEFARYATVGLRRAEADKHRQAVLRRLEKEHLAYQLHDSIVRGLIEIGFEAENGLLANEDPRIRHRLERIGRAAETCLSTIRERLAQLTAPDETADVPLGEVIAALQVPLGRSSIRPSFRLSGASASCLVPATIAAPLVSIGREALQNVELHSDASKVEVALELRGADVTLCVSDDGVGIDLGEASALLDRASFGHLGIAHMRRTAAGAGGRLRLVPSAAGGLRVVATLPLA